MFAHNYIEESNWHRWHCNAC